MALVLSLISAGWLGVGTVRAHGHQDPPAPAPSTSGQDAPAPTLEEIHAAAKPALIKCLLQTAEWCNDNELYQERENIYREVLAIDTDNAAARKGLRYARNVDGTWKDPAPRDMKNRNDKALAQLPAKRTQLFDPYSDALLECMERMHAGEALRALVIAEVRSLSPNNGRLHDLFNDVLCDGKWVGSETVAGKKWRAAIKTLIQAKQAVPAATALNPATAGVRTLDKRWLCALQTPHVRILGDVPEAECREIARQCEVANAVLHDVLGCPVDDSGQYTVYVFACDKDKYAVVRTLPDQGIEGRAKLVSRPNVTLDGTGCLFLSDDDPAKRVDCAVRCFLEQRLSKAFGLSTKQAWALDGVGWYLTRELCGTHLTWSTPLGVNSDPESLNAKLAVPDSNWMAEAAKLFDREKPPRIDAVIALEPSAMHEEEMLTACALATFLFEGYGAKLPEILQRLGRGEPTADVMHTVLGLSMEELQQRMGRWLKERQ